MVRKKSQSARVSNIDELILFQKDLRVEGDFLEKLLSKIDEQIHALQVEQLNLINSMCTSTMKTTSNKLDTKSETPTDTTLDLSVSTPMDFVEEEEEDDE